MQAKIQKITPSIASQYLSTQLRNRKVKLTHVQALSRALREGTFWTSGDTIRFNQVGELIDGQHRLLACIDSGVSFEAIIVTELEDKARDVIDTGIKKTPGDIFGLKGYTDGNNLAATLRWLWRYDNNFMIAYPIKPQTSHLDKTLEKHPTVKDSLGVGQGMGRLMTRSLAGALHTLFGEKSSREAHLFFNALRTGEGLFKGDPKYALRVLLEKNATRKAKLPPHEIAAVVIKAFNAHMKGRKIKSLRWITGGELAEEFPEIL